MNQSEIKPELDKLKGEKDPAALKQIMDDYVRSTADLIAAFVYRPSSFVWRSF